MLSLRTARSSRARPLRTAPVGTSSNPVPFGTTFRLGNGWSLKVDSITPDATAIVMAENMFNKAPAPGGQFFIATVTLTNVSSADI